jgi:carbon monoxide dehydrogenase subunit G
VAEFGASVVINRPVEDIWKFVTDLSNASECFVRTVEFKQTSPGPIGVGATLLHRTVKRTFTGHVTEYEPNRRFTTEATSGPIKGSKEVFSFEAVDGKTRLTYTGYLEGNGFYKLIGPFILGRSVRQGKAECESRVNNIKRILESEVHV